MEKSPRKEKKFNRELFDSILNSKKLELVMKREGDKLRGKWRKMITGDESKRIRDHLQENQGNEKYVKFGDKIAFTFGILNICLIQYFLLNESDEFWLWYSGMMPVLMIIRWVNYTESGYQYFMLDFCYFTLVCTFIMMYVIRESASFFRMVFIFANGPLMIAIPAWRNSFVFHDYEKMTSCYLHILRKYT